MKRQSISFLILVLGIILLIFWLPANRAMFSKGEIRAAMDIGSGATNLKVAKVDPKTDKIIAILFEKTIPVAYQKHLEQSSNNTLDQEIMGQGIQTIKALKEMADSFHVKKVVAVATAAFRQAANAEQFAREIKQQTGVEVRIINQDEEGILAFRGAVALTSVEPQAAIVWDIGGGSMQLTTLSDEGTYLVEKGKTASIPFKNAVIEQIQHKDLQGTHTPNPMTKEEMQAAIGYASKLAQETSPFIKDKLLKPKAQVIGVGNLFNKAVTPLVKSQVIHQDKLETAVMNLEGKTDSDFPKGSVADVAVTNPLLVLGYMKGLAMQQVEVIDINNADGALTYAPYWQ